MTGLPAVVVCNIIFVSLLNGASFLFLRNSQVRFISVYFATVSAKIILSVAYLYTLFAFEPNHIVGGVVSFAVVYVVATLIEVRALKRRFSGRK